jgi:cellulose synthase operon protein C
MREFCKRTVLLTIMLWMAIPCRAADMSKARSLLMHGRYAEATEIYQWEAKKSAPAALGWAACLEAQGKTDEAVKVLVPLAEKSAEIQAQLARLAFERGDRLEAGRRADATLRLASEHPLALYLLGELARTSGGLGEAEKHYRRLINIYNSQDVKKADSLRWIGRAAAQYARWNRLGDQFDFLVKDLYPAAKKLDADYWPAHYEAGLLFMEKYNRADAAKEFQAALEINPRAAEVHVAIAELAMADFRLEQAEASLRRAMEINPHLLAAWRLTADVAWLNGQTNEALRLLREKVLPLNPPDEATLARIAACYLVLDGTPGKATSPRLEGLIAEVTRRNPHAGEFHHELAEMLEVRNKQSEAERHFREAIRLLPCLPQPHAGLGLLMMRIGREAEARALLKEAIEADPFHVRVKNSLEVLDVLAGMQSRVTPHFVIKHDKADARLANYLARELETVFSDLKQQFGYAPSEPTLVEVFHESHGQSGHAWFSARMVGLPFLGTVAASTGRIVAVVSPAEMRATRGFPWATTLKHEMVHVFNLQQTGYNIPHWFTEGLAVHSEKHQRPYRWTIQLHKRAAAGTLMDLATVNAGFARAMDGDDCQLAYCQSELYVDYMLALGGSEALKNMVRAYAESPATDAAIRKVFNIAQADFERGYKAFVQKQIDATPVLASSESPRIDDLEKEHRRQPKDAAIAAQLALAYFRRGATTEAYISADEALKLDPKQPLATYVLARMHKAGAAKEEMARLESCLDHTAPEPFLLNLLAGLKLRAQKYDEATELYALGEKFDAANPQWAAGRARVYLAAGQKLSLARALARLAQLQPGDLPARKKLAELALERREAEEARRWATEAMEIQVEDAEVHRLLAAALVELGEMDHAIEEFDVAVELNPAHLQQRFALADALLQARQTARAKKVLAELLRRDPKFPGADSLLESLEKKP